MRGIGQLYAIYAAETKGAWPIVAWKPATGGCKVPPTNTIIVAYWYNFLEKYASKAGKLGAEVDSTNSVDIANSQRSVFWGCPAWDGRVDLTFAGGVDKYQTGIAMQQDPTFQPDYPSVKHPAPDGSAIDTPNTDKACVRADYATPVLGRFFKAAQWTKPGQRVLLGDCRYWILEVDSPGGTHIPDTLVNAFPNASYDFYRHGRYPRISGSGASAVFDGYNGGGRVMFNVLYCDGHAATLISREEGYRGVRMKFPG